MKTLLYVVRFSDDRIKIGISADVPKRMTYYRQEARRNNVPALIWFAAAPFSEKFNALLAERIICRVYQNIRIPHHREWFVGDRLAYAEIVKTAKELRMQLDDESEVGTEELSRASSFGYFYGLVA